MSSCHLTAGCSPETHYGKCHTDGQGTTHLSVPGVTTNPQQHALGQPQHKAGAVTGPGEAAHLSLWGGQVLTHITQGEVVHTQQFFSWSVLQMTLGDRESTGIEYTHTSLRTSYCKLSQSSLRASCWWLRWQGWALHREQESEPKMALPRRFPFWMPSRQDGSGPGWLHHSNSSEFLQQKSLLGEIQTELTSAIACAVIQREASANKSC